MGEKPGPQNDLLVSIRRGQTIESRLTTYQHGWLKGAQAAHNAGPTAFKEWIGQQTKLANEYGVAVITGAQEQQQQSSTSTAGGGGGTKTGG